MNATPGRRSAVTAAVLAALAVAAVLDRLPFRPVAVGHAVGLSRAGVVGRVPNDLEHFDGVTAPGTTLDPVLSDLAVRATTALERGDAAAAEGLYREMVRLYPGDAAAHESLGVCLGFQGRLDEARACYLTALELDPRSERAYRCLGDNDISRGRLDAAIEHLTRANALQEHGLSHWSLAVVYERKGDDARAVVHYRRALDLGQIDANARTVAEERVRAAGAAGGPASGGRRDH